MDNNSDEKFLVVPSTIEANMKDTDQKQMKTDEKPTKITEDIKFLTATITSMMYQNNNSKLSPAQKDTSNLTDITTVVPANRRNPPLNGGHSTKIGGILTPKHEIRSPYFYELLIKTELKVDTDLDLNNFYKHINIFLNAFIRLR